MIAFIALSHHIILPEASFAYTSRLTNCPPGLKLRSHGSEECRRTAMSGIRSKNGSGFATARPHRADDAMRSLTTELL